MSFDHDNNSNDGGGSSSKSQNNWENPLHEEWLNVKAYKDCLERSKMHQDLQFLFSTIGFWDKVKLNPRQEIEKAATTLLINVISFISRANLICNAL